METEQSASLRAALLTHLLVHLGGLLEVHGRLLRGVRLHHQDAVVLGALLGAQRRVDGLDVLVYALSNEGKHGRHHVLCLGRVGHEGGQGGFLRAEFLHVLWLLRDELRTLGSCRDGPVLGGGGSSCRLPLLTQLFDILRPARVGEGNSICDPLVEVHSVLLEKSDRRCRHDHIRSIFRENVKCVRARHQKSAFVALKEREAHLDDGVLAGDLRHAGIAVLHVIRLPVPLAPEGLNARHF